MPGFTDICSMHILLVSATAREITQTSEWLRLHSNTTEQLVTGVGQLQTAFHLLKKIYTHRPAFIIQAGIGGSSNPEDTGKVFSIYSEKLADLGVEEQKHFKSIFDLGLGEPDIFPFRNGVLVNPYARVIEWSDFTLREGITVNEISTDLSRVNSLKQRSRPVVESMEGAVLHYVCLMEKIPFLQIRSISNVLGDRDKTRWKLDEAIANLNVALIGLIQKLETIDETLFRI